jgi:hypothetical protein
MTRAHVIYIKQFPLPFSMLSKISKKMRWEKTFFFWKGERGRKQGAHCKEGKEPREGHTSSKKKKTKNVAFVVLPCDFHSLQE